MGLRTLLLSIACLPAVAVADGVLSWGSVVVDGDVARAQLLWQGDDQLAGFQFECAQGTFLWAGEGAVESLGWQINYQGDMVLCFTMDPTTYVPPSCCAEHLISMDVSVSIGTLELVDSIFADPAGEMITVTGPGPLELDDNTCAGDVSGDGVVGVDDILIVLANWGMGTGGDADGDGATDVNDILLVISAWGDC